MGRLLMPRQPKNGGRKCGAALHNGSGLTCKHPAGYRTNHIGWGKCIYHGGASQSLTIAANREQAASLARLFGGAIDIRPEQALAQEVCRTAGHVEWLSERVSELADGSEEITDLKRLGIEAGALLQIYQQERKHLVQAAEAACRIGIDERTVKLAELQGTMVAQAFQLLIEGLQLTPEQKLGAPALVRRALMQATSLELGTG